MKGNLTELKNQYEALGEEIKKLEDSPFVPGWYVYWDNNRDVYHIEYVEKESVYKGAFWDNIVPVTQGVLNKFLPKMYDWSKAPDWAQWAATDSNGIVYWYGVKPYVDRFYNRWMSYHRAISIALDAKCPVNWEESLEERPNDR